MYRVSLMLCAALLIAIPAYAQSNDWVDDWLAGATMSGPKAFRGQQRGFYSAGTFQARINTSVDHPLTVSMPRMNAGCGGIDVFLGGMSFLDEEYLVQKLESILAAAPALAFDIALKTMCKECADTLAKLEELSDFLNGLQLNECSLSKRVVAEVRSDDPDILGGVWNEISAGRSLDLGLFKNHEDHQDQVRANDGNPPEDLKDQIANCPSDFRELFGGGSVLQKAAELVGLHGYTDIMRGMIGDVEVRAGSGDRVPLGVAVSPCPENNDVGIDDFIYGTAYRRQSVADGGACVDANYDGFDEAVRNNMVSVRDKIVSGADLSGADIAFIESAPLPIHPILTDAVRSGMDDVIIDTLDDVLAYGMAWRAMDDLHRHTGFMLRKAVEVTQQSGVENPTDPGECNIALFQHVIPKVVDFSREARMTREMMRQAYIAMLQESFLNMRVAQAYRDQRDRSDAEDSSSVAAQ